MYKKFIKLVVVAVGLVTAQFAHATDWSADQYDLYAGDFNGDGKSDILYVAKDSAGISGIAASDGSAPNIPWQTWPSNYLGIPWSGNQYRVVVADFNGDSKADILLQRSTSGDSYLLFVDGGGKIVAINQTISNSALGITWSADQHKIVAGDINNDGKADLFLQATSSSGTNAVVYADSSGMFTAGPTQTWSEGYLGLNWSAQSANVFIGDFNGDHQSDLLVQAKPKFVMIDYDVTFPVPTYPPNMNGVAYSQGGNTPYQLAGVQTWSRMNNGVDWSPLTNTLSVGDFNGDGRADILFQAKYSTGTSYLLNGTASGAAFPTAATAISSSTIPLSSDSNKLVVGNFDGGAATGFYIQALTATGTNYTVNSVSSTVTATTHNPSTATGTSPATAVGHTSGSFAVSNSGAATYSIPITVPPGVSGIQPSLSIGYQSSGGNGLLGVGWGLGGLSQIHRCGKTLTQDGAAGGVTLTNADKYCLDGNKLRLTGGGYGAASSTYQTEMETFSRTTASPTLAGNGPAYFTVEAKDGLKYEYGNSVDSRIESLNPSATTTPRVWALNRVSDRAGNTMTISYVEDGASNGGFRPDEILYTYNSNAGLSAAAKVKFFWEDRPDISFGYFAGGLIKETKRLNRIETQYNSAGSFQLVRKYQFSYNTASSTYRSRLSAVQECDGNGYCLSPTVFSWQDGINGWSSDEAIGGANSSALMKFAHTIDVDADGASDVVYPDTASGTIYWFYMRGNTSGGFATPVNTWIPAGDSSNQQYAFAMPINAFGSGSLGLLATIPNYGTRQVISWTGSGLSVTNTNISIALNGRQWVSDVTGDGRDDFVYATQNSNGGIFYVQSNMGGGSFAAATQWYTESTNPMTNTPFNGATANKVRLVDANGDGLGDILYVTERLVTEPGVALSLSHSLSAKVLISNGNSFSAGGGVGAHTGVAGARLEGTLFTGDFNGDGKTDLALNQADRNSPPNYKIAFGTGTGFVSQVQFQFSFPQGSNNQIAADFDGDGRTDILYVPYGVNTWMLMRAHATGFDSAVSTNIPDVGGATSRVADFNGDGLADVAYQSGSYRVRKHTGAVPDLLKSATDGFGNSVNVTYAPLTDVTVYTKGSGAVFPEIDIQSPMHVVKQHTLSDGVGGSFAINRTYSGARAYLQGRGSEGFASLTETDSRTGIKTKITFNQQFPKTGTVASTAVTQPNGNAISFASTSYIDLVTSSTQYNDRHYVYASSSTQISSEVSASNASIDGAPVKSVVTSVDGVDSFGNVTVTTTTTSDQTGSGQSFTATTSNTVTNDTTNWCLGFVTEQQVITSMPNARPLDGNASPIRRLKYERDADPAKCRVFRQTIEPNTSSQVVTTFEFDSLGHTKKTIMTAAGIANRVAEVSYGASGVFPVQFTNAVGEVSYKSYDYALGVPLTATDPNGIQASFQYDGFGRKTRANAPDGTATTWTLSSCNGTNGYCGDGLLRYKVTQQQLDGTASHNVVRTDVQFHDALNRVLYTQAQTFSGAYSIVKSIYNNKGQLVNRSVPHFQGFSPTYSTNYYDLLGRVLRIERQASETDTSMQTIEYTYAKLMETVKDQLGRVTTKTTNAIGQVTQVADANNSVTLYEYDALGNLARTTDSAGNQISNTFNVRGFKVASSDPDMGNWSYTYYPSGELWTQTDAKNQTATFTYDNISRIKTRAEPEGITTWNYGTSAAARNIGQLEYVCMGTGANCTGQTYREAYTYDSLGRTQNIAYTEDTTYQVDYTYNNQGALNTLEYPTSTSGYRLKLQYAYANGQLAQVRDFNSASTQYWTLNATNAASQAIDELMANGVRIISDYDGISGSIAVRQSGNGGSTTNLQSLSYVWDKAGNLTKRYDNLQSGNCSGGLAGNALCEVFAYDNLNRLDSSTRNGTQNLDVTVNAIGNLTKKDDFNTSTYDYTSAQAGCTYYTHTQPHAVRKIGSNVYCYDANGNMTKRANGSTISWASYNLPSQINSGSNYSQFSYGPSRQRWKQVANYGGTAETTIYVGGLVEKVTRSGVTEYKHYIAGGSATAIYTRRSNGTTSTYYVTSDHLGSADVITDGTGAAVVRESFAAYGARRGSNWTGTPSAADQAQFTNTTRHGYTGHEMLDNLDLIHMNGRVYDPGIGRFISADPYVQSPLSQQSLNRYSYVSNGPMSATDPSGYFTLGDLLNPLDEDNPLNPTNPVGRTYLAYNFGLALYGDYSVLKIHDDFFLRNPDLQFIPKIVVGAVVTYYAGWEWGAVAYGAVDAHFTRINGGSNSDVLRSFVVGTVTSYAFNVAGTISNPVLNTLAHAAIGCGSAAASGGNCGQGALAAGFGAAYSNTGLDGGFLGAAIAGGIGAELGGGDFAEGAQMAGMAYMLNHALHTFPEVTEKYWGLAYDSNGNPISKTDLYGSQWQDIAGAGGALDLVLRRGLHLEFQVRIDTYGEFNLWHEFTRTTKYAVTSYGNFRYESTPIFIGSPKPTNKIQWTPNGNVTNRLPSRVRACPVTCAYFPN